jgi:two-component sensor histidine kinase
MKAVLFVLLLCWMPVHLWAQEGDERNRREGIKPDSLLSIGQLISKAAEVSKQDTATADSIFRIAVAKAIRDTDFYSAGMVQDEIGEMYFRHKAHNRSLGAFIKAKDFFGKAGAVPEQAFANFKLGRAQYYRGNYKLASGHLTYALQSARKLKLRSLEADGLEYLGILYHVMPNPRYQSTVLLNKSLRLKQQLNDRNGALRIMERLAAIYYDQKDFDSALHFNTASVALAETLTLNYDAALLRLNGVPALLRLNKGAEAARRLDFIKARLPYLSDLNISFRYYTQAGNYRLWLQDAAAAQRNYDTALQMTQKTGFPELSSLVYQNMANAYFHHGDFKKAYEYQLKFNTARASLYSKENFNTFKELEYIFNASITEDEVAYLNFQNRLKEAQLKNGKKVRFILIASALGLLFSAMIITILYGKQRTKNRIIEKQGADLKMAMKEIHHRVKNNLQVISSLLDLQALTIGDGQAAKAIRESRNRVQTMALIHQNFYQEESGTAIEMEGYINSLAQHLFSAYNVKASYISLHTKIDAVTLNADTAIGIGLVLNELISNALKHAFCRNETGILQITLEQKEDHLLLAVRDNGAGFPPHFNIHQAETFGYKLVRAFSHKLKARLHVFNDNGACVQLHLPKLKMKP